MTFHWGKILAIPAAVGALLVAGHVATSGPVQTASTYRPPLAASSKAAPGRSDPATAVIIGDSYTAGAVGVTPYPEATCTALGWICNIDAEGGTGYLASGHANSEAFTAYLGRLGTTGQEYTADYVVVTGGRNDIGGNSAAQETATREYYRQVRAVYPRATIVAVQPFWGDENRPANLLRLQQDIRRAAAGVDAYWIPTAGWLNPTLIGPDHIHPTVAGSKRITRKMIAALRLVEQRKAEKA